MGDETTHWMTSKEAAEHAGVSLESIKNYIREGRLPAYRRGKRSIVIKQSDVDATFAPKRIEVEGQ